MWQSSARGRSSQRKSRAEVSSRQRHFQKPKSRHADFEWVPVQSHFRQESFLRDCDSVPLCVCTLPWSKRGCTCNRNLFAFSRSREVQTQHQAAQTHHENEGVPTVGCDGFRGDIPSPPESSTVLRGPLQVAPPQTRPPRVILRRRQRSNDCNSRAQADSSRSPSLTTDFRGPRPAVPPRSPPPHHSSEQDAVLSTSLRPMFRHGSSPSLEQNQVPVPQQKHVVTQQKDVGTSTEVTDCVTNTANSPAAQSKPHVSSAKPPHKASTAPLVELNHGPRIIERRTPSHVSRNRGQKKPRFPVSSSVAESNRSATRPPEQESSAGDSRTLAKKNATNATTARKNIFSPEIVNQSYLIDGHGMLEQSYLQRSAALSASGSDRSDTEAKPHYLQANYILRPMSIASRLGSDTSSTNRSKVTREQQIPVKVETLSSRKVLLNDSCATHFSEASEPPESSLHEQSRDAGFSPGHSLQTDPKSTLQKPELVASLVIRADELQSDSGDSTRGQALLEKQAQSTTVRHSLISDERMPQDVSAGLSVEQNMSLIHQEAAENPLLDNAHDLISSGSTDDENDENESNHSSSMSLVEDFSQLTEQLVQEALQKALHNSHTIDVGVPNHHQPLKLPETTDREPTSRPAIDASLLALQKPRCTTAKQVKAREWRFGNSSTSTARFAFVTPSASQNHRKPYVSGGLRKRSTPFSILRDHLQREQQPNIAMTKLKNSPSMDVQRRILSALQRDHFFDGINVDISDDTERTDESSYSRGQHGERGEYSDRSKAVDDADWEGGLSDFETVGSVDDAEFMSLLPEEPGAASHSSSRDKNKGVPASSVLERLIDRDHKRALPQQPDMLLSDTD